MGPFRLARRPTGALGPTLGGPPGRTIGLGADMMDIELVEEKQYSEIQGWYGWMETRISNYDCPQAQHILEQCLIGSHGKTVQEHPLLQATKKHDQS